MGALFLHLKPDEYLKKLYKTKKLVEKTRFLYKLTHPCFGCVFLYVSSKWYRLISACFQLC
ncbi:hypothetical protein LXE94_17300 [Bacillus subtilis]|nr:hypothetical protein [Bacillus subtilis]UVB74895.1 hypothetical protein LXE94_17300 [Bacillus subtilis]